jgi:hypothetical protein
MDKRDQYVGGELQEELISLSRCCENQNRSLGDDSRGGRREPGRHDPRCRRARWRMPASSAPWPAPGSEDTELGVLMELEVGHGETEV